MPMIPLFRYLLYTALPFIYIFFSFNPEFYWNTGIKESNRIIINKLTKNFTGNFTGIYRYLLEYTGI